MIKNIIFDFDGVIADTFEINRTLSFEHDSTASEEDFLAHHDGNVHEEPKIKFKAETVHLFVSEYQKRVTNVHLEKSIESIKRLAEKYTLYIISSTAEPAINSILENAGILGLFERVLGAETNFSKVAKFKILMNEHGVTTGNTIFVTDTLGDIKEATKVGLRTIAETFGFHPRERLAQGNPYALVDSWKEIENEILKLSSLGSNKDWQSYVEKTKNAPPRPLLVKALEYVADKGEALDLGSGALNDVRYLISDGFRNITAVDSTSVDQDIIKNFPSGSFSYIVSTFEDFEFVENKYDLINAQYSLPFNPEGTVDKVFESIVTSLKIGGILTGQLFGTRDEWNRIGHKMNFHNVDQVKRMLDSLEIIDFEEEESDKKTAKGDMKHWHVFHFIVRKI